MSSVRDLLEIENKYFKYIEHIVKGMCETNKGNSISKPTVL